MQPAFVRFAAFAAIAALVTACGPSDVVGKDKLDPIEGGMPISRVAEIIGKGPLTPLQPSDSLRLYNGFRTQIFLAAGSQYRVIWYREEAGSIEDAITRERETPILIHADTVVGKGWSFYDDKAQELGIPNPYRDRERLDSISRAQTPTS
ncbi:MAG: hypothetical protein IBJ19_07855 [Gemmatimonadaceae bacterium]|nr:hypothetical protein [Gemmatimonadaceae bacterium]